MGLSTFSFIFNNRKIALLGWDQVNDLATEEQDLCGCFCSILWFIIHVILLLLSADIWPINTSDVVTLPYMNMHGYTWSYMPASSSSAIHAHATTLPPPSLIDDVYVLDHELFLFFYICFSYLHSGTCWSCPNCIHFFFSQNYPESYIFFLANSNLAVLFLSVMSGLHLFVSSWL